MIARLLISSSLDILKKEIAKFLASRLSGTNLIHLPGGIAHPDLLYFPKDSKLGIEQARKIKQHFSLKPYSAKGRVVVLEKASDLTVEAQNALLKTLEELPKQAAFILATDSDSKLLPTVVSRCEVTYLESNRYDKLEYHNKYHEDIIKLISYSLAERFEYVEKLKDKQEFLHILTQYFRELLHAPRRPLARLEIKNFLQEILQAEQWANQNVNPRAILEYLMLILPQL